MVMTTGAEGSTLQLRDVRKSFPDPGDPVNRRLVLSGISVSLAAGELVSLLGQCRGLGAEKVAARLESELLAFEQGEPRDDLALVVLRVVEAVG